MSLLKFPDFLITRCGPGGYMHGFMQGTDTLDGPFHVHEHEIRQHSARQVDVPIAISESAQ